MPNANGHYVAGERVLAAPGSRGLNYSMGSPGTVLHCGDGWDEVCVDWDDGYAHYTDHANTYRPFDKFIESSHANPLLDLSRKALALIGDDPKRRAVYVELSLKVLTGMPPTAKVSSDQIRHAIKVLRTMQNQGFENSKNSTSKFFS